MTRFRLLRPIAVPRISGAVAATGDLSAATGGGGGSGVSSNPVTTALNATGSGTRYDVTSDAQMDAVPWGSLGPGSVVNIFHKATAYLRKPALRCQGTSANPVIVNGVTDASGNRPVIQCSGAGVQTAAGCNPGGANNIFTATPANGESLGGFVVKMGANDDYNTYAPKWFQIKNLEIWGAGGLTGRTYTSTVTGTSQTYGASAGGVYLHRAEDALIENCVIYDNGFGVFMMAKDELLIASCKRVTVRNCRVYNNGVSASYLEHNFYVQCANPIIEGNYIGRVRTGSEGSSYKSRSSGEIFRYNYVEGSARVLDFVHSEGQSIDGIATLPDYGTDYCYGNILVNDVSLGGYAGNMIHVGGDNQGEDDIGAFTLPIDKYRQKLYFFNNTVIYRGQNASNPYRAAIFDLSLSANNPNTSKGAPSTVESWNNIYVYNGISANPTEPGWMEYAGVLNHHGNNVAWGTFQAARSDALTGRYVLNNAGSLITSNPAFVDLAGHNYALTAGSAARGQATSPAAVASVIAAHPVIYQPRMASNGMVSRPTTADLGACEFGVA